MFTVVFGLHVKSSGKCMLILLTHFCFKTTLVKKKRNKQTSSPFISWYDVCCNWLCHKCLGIKHKPLNKLIRLNLPVSCVILLHFTTMVCALGAITQIFRMAPRKSFVVVYDYEYWWADIYMNVIYILTSIQITFYKMSTHRPHTSCPVPLHPHPSKFDSNVVLCYNIDLTFDLCYKSHVNTE